MNKKESNADLVDEFERAVESACAANEWGQRGDSGQYRDALKALLQRMSEHDPVAVAAMNLAERVDEFFPSDTAHSDFLKELREYRIARGPSIDSDKIIGETQR